MKELRNHKYTNICNTPEAQNDDNKNNMNTVRFHNLYWQKPPLQVVYFIPPHCLFLKAAKKNLEDSSNFACIFGPHLFQDFILKNEFPCIA